MQVADGVGVLVTVGVGVAPVGDGDGLAFGVVVIVAVRVGVEVRVGIVVAVAVGVAPTMPCPESSMCCGLFLAESVNVNPFFFLTFPKAVGRKTTTTSHVPTGANGEPEHRIGLYLEGR